MLDPSCSGSGMTSNHTENSISRDPLFSNDRIKTLSNFQFQALYHATTDFPKVDRVVYSTCSLYVQENEGVVQRLLSSNSNWELCPPTCLESWHRRGLVIEDDNESNKDSSFVSLTQDQAKCLIRVNPDEDATNGFFVACFQRKTNDGEKDNKGGKKASSKVPVGVNINIPKGMELYNNQFYSEEANSAPVKGKPNVDTKKSKVSSSDTTGASNGNSNGKRKVNEISSPAAAAAASDEPSSSFSKKISKKHAKKLGWKKRQRLKKEARLKSQAEKTPAA